MKLKVPFRRHFLVTLTTVDNSVTWFLPVNEEARSHLSFIANACRNHVLDVLQIQRKKLWQFSKSSVFCKIQ